MSHPNRSRRHANATALERKRARVKKSLAQAVPGAKRAAVLARYPDPPKYADDGKPQSVQPLCYEYAPLFGRSR